MDKATLKNKTILVTGGSGSIGKALVKELLEHDPKSIRILSRSEYSMHLVMKEFKTDRIRYLIGDIYDIDRVRLAVAGADIVFHVAALKNLDLTEQYNSPELVKTNVIGTSNVVNACIEENSVQKLIYVSSDKAVMPTSAYGMSKALGEKLVLWGSKVARNEKVFCCVRFGNVVGSRGSVTTVWENQKLQGLPLTVTHEEMERYYISLDEVVKFLIKVEQTAKGGEIFVPKNMDKVKIYDAAKKISPNIRITGIRKGEKIKEYLWTDEESRSLKEINGMHAII